MDENFLWILSECSTIWGIWPLKLCNISRSVWSWLQLNGTVMQNWTSGPWCPTKAVRSLRRELLLACIHTQKSGARRSHTGATFPCPLVKADRQNKGTRMSHVSQCKIFTRSFPVHVSVGNASNRYFTYCYCTFSLLKLYGMKTFWKIPTCLLICHFKLT